MCSCRTKWVVTYPADEAHPNGWTETKQSAVAARIAAGKVPGARYEAVGK